MKRLGWSKAARNDLVRLHDFLNPVDPRAAKAVVSGLRKAAGRLVEYPRIGRPITGFAERDVRRVIVGHYEIRYEVRDDAVFVLRIWHTREQR